MEDKGKGAVPPPVTTRTVEGSGNTQPLDLTEEGNSSPESKVACWNENTQVFPVFNDVIDFRRIKNKRNRMEESKESSNVTFKGQSLKENVSKESVAVEKQQTTPKVTGHEGPVDIWSSQRMLKEFTIYSALVDPVILSKSENLANKTSGVMEDTLPLSIDIQEEFARKSFYAMDNLTKIEIYVDPTKSMADDNGYYTVYDPATLMNFIIDPPKLVILDPITKKELVIDPRKPVGQYYSVKDENGESITLDTSDQQAYIHEDPVTGARFLKDETRVKPFIVKDPQTGADVRIDPLQTDGKPYVYMDDQGETFSVLPVMPGGTPILFDDPKTGEPSILGGPVMIRDPRTGEMEYQEGPFMMRDPKTGQGIKQIGPIIKTDPKTGEVTLMSNPQYVKHPQTGEMVLEPSIKYKIQDNGTLIPTLPESDQHFKYNKNGETMAWDEKLGVFIAPKAREIVNKKQGGHDMKQTEAMSASGELIIGGNKVRMSGDTHSVESILGPIVSHTEQKRIKKFLGTETEDLRCIIHTMLSHKKQVERLTMQTLLTDKEKTQNLFIHHLIQHLGNRLKYYDKEMFKVHVLENIRHGNEKLIGQVEEKIKIENNKALDAILIELDNEKKRILGAINVKGSVREFPIHSPSQQVEVCQKSENVYYKKALEVFRHFKGNTMKLFNEALKRENEHIRRELLECLKKEMEFVDKKINELFMKICCERYLIIQK